MFARTERLTLRPGWPEDADALAHAIGHESVVTRLARAPWPYARADAQTFLAGLQQSVDPVFVILAHGGGDTRLVGGIGLHADADGCYELGYWLTPDAWGRGYATEAGSAVLAMARHALGIRRIAAWHFVDNPASGRVLRKLGFRATGAILPRRSVAREHASPAALYTLAFDDADSDDPVRMAA